jgi:hypothetical protein
MMRFIRAFRLAWRLHQGLPQIPVDAAAIVLQPGDVLVVRSDKKLDAEAKQAIREMFSNRVVFLRGCNLYVIRELP